MSDWDYGAFAGIAGAGWSGGDFGGGGGGWNITDPAGFAALALATGTWSPNLLNLPGMEGFDISSLSPPLSIPSVPTPTPEGGVTITDPEGFAALAASRGGGVTITDPEGFAALAASQGGRGEGAYGADPDNPLGGTPEEIAKSMGHDWELLTSKGGIVLSPGDIKFLNSLGVEWNDPNDPSAGFSFEGLMGAPDVEYGKDSPTHFNVQSDYLLYHINQEYPAYDPNSALSIANAQAFAKSMTDSILQTMSGDAPNFYVPTEVQSAISAIFHNYRDTEAPYHPGDTRLDAEHNRGVVAAQIRYNQLIGDGVSSEDALAMIQTAVDYHLFDKGSPMLPGAQVDLPRDTSSWSSIKQEGYAWGLKFNSDPKSWSEIGSIIEGYSSAVDPNVDKSFSQEGGDWLEGFNQGYQDSAPSPTWADVGETYWSELSGGRYGPLYSSTEYNPGKINPGNYEQAAYKAAARHEVAAVYYTGARKGEFIKYMNEVPRLQHLLQEITDQARSDSDIKTPLEALIQPPFAPFQKGPDKTWQDLARDLDFKGVDPKAFLALADQYTTEDGVINVWLITGPEGTAIYVSQDTAPRSDLTTNSILSPGDIVFGDIADWYTRGDITNCQILPANRGFIMLPGGQTMAGGWIDMDGNFHATPESIGARMENIMYPAPSGPLSTAMGRGWLDKPTYRALPPEMQVEVNRMAGNYPWYMMGGRELAKDDRDRPEPFFHRRHTTVVSIVKPSLRPPSLAKTEVLEPQGPPTMPTLDPLNEAAYYLGLSGPSHITTRDIPEFCGVLISLVGKESALNTILQAMDTREDIPQNTLQQMYYQIQRR